MTRINVGIRPSELPGPQLLAEHREIKRIPNTVRSGRARIRNIPNRFCLGKGHVKFFYDKLLYLAKRYDALHAECLRRGYNVTNYASCWEYLPEELLGDYAATRRDRKILLSRFKEKQIKLLNIKDR